MQAESPAGKPGAVSSSGLQMAAGGDGRDGALGPRRKFEVSSADAVGASVNGG
jgi:hypothetical protein